MSLSPESVHRPAPGWRLLAIGAAIAALAVPVAGLVIYRPRAEARARAELAETLRSRAEIRAAAISRWADVGLRDAQLVANYPSAIELLRTPQPSAAIESHLVETLRPFVGIKGYGQVLVVRDGQVVARAANRSTSPDCLVVPHTGGRTAVGLHKHEDGRIWATFAARIALPGRHEAAVVLEQPASDYLFAALSRSPLPYASTESSLVEPHGAGFIYLTPLKSHVQRAGTETIEAGSPMARLLQDRRASSATTVPDYRGVETFVAGSPVAGTRWLTTLKVDESDALAAPRRIVRMTILAWSAVAMSAALATAAALLWQRRRHDAASAREQRRVGTILNHASDPILFLSPDGRIAHANQRANEFYGDEGLIGRSLIDDLVGPQDRITLRERLSVAAATGEVVVETNHRRADGTVAPVEMSVRRLTLDDDTHLVAVVRDLSARREVESALRRSESLFRTVFQKSPIGILMGTLDGRILRANPAVEHMLGYSAAELTTMTFNDLTAPEDRQRKLAIESGSTTPAHGARVEKRYVHKDGLITWGEVTVTLVRDEKDDTSFALVLVQDISERRALQDQLFQAQKMESIGRLAGGVAHDFNNLLTAILGYAEVLEDEVRGNPQARGFVEEIQHAGSRAATLTAQLLAFARRQVVTRRVLDLNEIVDDAGRMLHRLLGRSIQTELRLASNLWRVDADPNQLQQVIVNMAVNASDAMPNGGRLIIETANERLEETRHRVDALFGDYVRLTVSDTGEGMPQDVLAHIFEPFFTTREQGKGTGLGLAMCHGIVTQNGGQIRVMSEPGRGTAFHVYLPKARRAAAAAERAPVAALAHRGGQVVLLAEDETPVRTLAARVLKGRGFRVLEAQDGGEALRSAEAHADEIDLLLTDVTMPVLGGRELAERFRHVCPGAKILFMSGHPESVIAHDGVLDPGVAYVAKPFTPDQISSRVKDVLAGA